MPRIMKKTTVDVDNISDDEGGAGMIAKDKTKNVKGSARRNFGIKADAVAEELVAEQVDVTDNTLEFKSWSVGEKLKRKHFVETTSADIRKTLLQTYGNGDEKAGREYLENFLAASITKASASEESASNGDAEGAEEAAPASTPAVPEAPEVTMTLEELTSKIGGEPDFSTRPGDWFLYQVQRIRFADSTLSVLEFNNVELPLPKDEVLLLPALLHAVTTLKKKCTLDRINANACRVNRESGLVFAAIVKSCKSLTRLLLEKNDMDIIAVKALAESLKSCKRLEEIKLSQQSQISSDARAMEVAFAEAMETNETVCRLGIVLKDPASRNKIDTATVRNGELRRKRIKKEKKKAEAKALGEPYESSGNEE